MIYPTIRQYIDALLSPKQSFGTKELRAIKLCCDDMDEPIYSAQSSWVVFDICVGKELKTLRVFTAQSDKNSECTGTLYPKALFVVTNRCADYYDIIIDDISRPKPCVRAELVERENRIPFEKDGLWGFMDSERNIVIEAKYQSVGDFYEARTVVVRDGCYGLVDRDGREVIEARFDDLSYDNSYYCIAENDGNFGLFNRLGEVVLDVEWDWIGEFSKGLAVVMRDGKYGYVDGTGRIILDMIYDDASSFNEFGFATIRIGSEQYQIDNEGFRTSGITKIPIKTLNEEF